MVQFTKPMQPCNADLDKIQFPCVAQRKIDGMKLIIRSNNKGGIELLGRSMKPITNRWLHEKFTEVFAEFLQLKHFVFEGELQAGNSFEKCDGLLSALYREFDNVVFHIFDEISDASLPYSTRYQHAALAVKMLENPMVQLVNNFPIKDMESLLTFHMMNEVNPALDGTIVRQMEMEYKAGKRTVNEGYVVKIKNEDDAEAEIIGVYEKMHNGNEGYTNPLGRTERSSAQAGKTGLGTLGGFDCIYRGGKEPIEFSIGSFKGLTDEQKQVLWNRRDQLPGLLIKFKFMRITKYGVPLHPVYLGFRDPIDLD